VAVAACVAGRTLLAGLHELREALCLNELLEALCTPTPTLTHIHDGLKVVHPAPMHA
jgi:hypothetical protein